MYQCQCCGATMLWCCGVVLRWCAVVVLQCGARCCGAAVLWCCGELPQVVAASSLHAFVFLFPPTDQNHPIRLIKTVLMNEGISSVMKWSVTRPGWVPAACLVTRMGSSQNENSNMEHVHANYNSKFRHLCRKSCLLRDTLVLSCPYASFIPSCKKISLPV